MPVDSNMWTRIQKLQDYLIANGRNNRFVIAGVPGKDHDKSLGYNKFDLCLNSLTDKVYECRDITDGAAVWVDTTLSLGGVTETGREFYCVRSQAAQLQLQADRYDVCLRADIGMFYERNAGATGTIADWTIIGELTNVSSSSSSSSSTSSSSSSTSSSSSSTSSSSSSSSSSSTTT